MSWRSAFIEHLGPGVFGGTTFGDWLRVLWENHGAVDPKFWPRAALITANSALNSAVRAWENHRYGSAIASTAVEPPVFILGIWRSGTTHLHNLLALDERFAFPTTYEVYFPHTFLTTEAVGGRIMQWLMPATRPMDNVSSGAGRPKEDELALVATGLSFMLGMLVFPRSKYPYQKYLTLRDASPDEVDRWKSEFMQFLQKLTSKHGRPLVLKSPGHTARIDVLLEMFPGAKFVHIHRNPYAVFQSSMHMFQKTQGFWALQESEVTEERILEDYVQIYDVFFAHRHGLTEENFCELSFDALERAPVVELRRIYQSLALPDFAHVEPRVRDYLGSLSGYEKNVYPAMPDATRRRVADAWRRSFEEWGYQK